ncbi:MAG: hypothetical protein ACM3O3_12555 [Syntrophothermus sp.]
MFNVGDRVRVKIYNYLSGGYSNFTNMKETFGGIVGCIACNETESFEGIIVMCGKFNHYLVRKDDGKQFVINNDYGEITKINQECKNEQK